jgi:hypothetical protein
LNGKALTVSVRTRAPKTTALLSDFRPDYPAIG